jgi:hypothetical protein
MSVWSLERRVSIMDLLRLVHNIDELALDG